MKTAEEIGRATLERFARQRQLQQEASAALRSRIEQLAAVDCGPARGRAKRILKLMPDPRPKLRTVQWHLQQIVQTRRHCANE